ncbi:MAG: hypothetical protein KME27_31425 [Lyngbya sp. HA4199-MV5]|jgi:hypothetical protein|nr:hypothetical protein [Lyngbya sp. HA4199-MV5]
MESWLMSLSAAIVVAACIAFPPLILVVVPGWIWWYLADKKQREGEK